MYPSAINIRTSPSTVSINQPFTISFLEPPCPNCSWEYNIPPSMSTLQISPSNADGSGLHEVTLTSSARGSFNLVFTYRKRCCGRPVIRLEEFMIHVL